MAISEYAPSYAPAWFRGKVRVEGECWFWTGAKTSDGYAQAKLAGRFTRVHRYAYEVYVGDTLEEDAPLHHLCGNKLCVNPAHLAPLASHSEHRQLHVAIAPPRTHCKHGHAFTPENTYWAKGKYRQCRTCHRNREKERALRLAVLRNRGD